MRPNKQAYDKQDGGGLRRGVGGFLESKRRKHDGTYFNCDYPMEVGEYEMENDGVGEKWRRSDVNGP